MESPKTKSSSSSSSLPPGCRFYPSEEQLLSYYLQHKNTLQLFSTSSEKPHFYDTIIKEINLYSFNPFELPELTCFRFGYKARKRHWYCFTERINGSDEDSRNRRKAGLGYWKRRGRVRDVMGNAGKAVLGRRKCFVFYLEKCNGKNAVRTDWLMYEYALLDSLKASFVVCRVFVNSRSQKSISEHAFSSCADESMAALRHIGIQHDGSTASVGEDKAHCCDHVNKITGQSKKLDEETEPNNLVNVPGFGSSTGLLANSWTSHLQSIIEGDYLELDDFV